GAFNLVRFLFSGDLGGDVSKLRIFANSPLTNAGNNFGLSQDDPGWSISTVAQDPFGNAYGSQFGGIELLNGTGQDLMEGASVGSAPAYNAFFNTVSPVTAWTVFAFDQAQGVWLSQSYGATVGFGNAPQILTGDYNGDGKVDAADYVYWRKNNVN